MVSRSTRMEAAAAVGTEISTLTTAAGEKGATIDYSALHPHKAITVDHVNRVLGVGTIPMKTSRRRGMHGKY